MSKFRYCNSMKSARRFATEIEKKGAEFVSISAYRDAFGVNQYVVKYFMY